MKRPRRNHSSTFADTAKNVTFSYTYNLAGQPMSATASNAAYRNTSARVAATYATDGLNRYSAVGASTLTYDGRSNLSSTGLQGFGYDGLNRMTSTTGTTLVYDALNRLNQVVSGAGTKFLYEGQQIIAEYNGSGALQRRYIPGPGLDNPYVWFEGTGTASSTARWLLGNAFGSIIAVGSTGGANTTLAINQYDEFGVGPTGNLGRFQYKGMAYVPEVGLYHARARTYSQYLGRFMQPDPSGYSDGMNLYAFVHNAPIGARDVLGLYGENPDCIRGPNHNECPGMQVTITPPSMDPASAPIHIDWPALSVPTLAGGGGGTGGKSAPQSQDSLPEIVVTGCKNGSPSSNNINDPPIEPVFPELWFSGGRALYALLAKVIPVLATAVADTAFEQAAYANAARNSLKDLGRGPLAPLLSGWRQPTLAESLAKVGGDPGAAVVAAGRTNGPVNATAAVLGGAAATASGCH